MLRTVGAQDSLDRAIAIEGHTDSNDLVKASKSLVYARGFHKRRKTDVFYIQDLQELGKLRTIRKIVGTNNPTDAGTKRQSFETVHYSRLRSMAAGWYSGDFRW